ncbi:MAG TPA: hypothetical protein PKB10_07285 [Tepidisphaeraceae bacterium]|nr:hypothetical protein [Tepidisphaeraceae bacterium]
MSMVRTMIVLMVCAIIAPAAFAQDGGSGRGERQPGGRGDPAQMRERMLQNLREQMQASDEEWTVLAPKIEKVQTILRESRMGGWGGRGGPGGRGGDQEPTTEIGRASRDLRTVLQNENASGEEITQALTAYRAAREKANVELAAARDDLKAVLTPRQEAILVMLGMLE